MSSGLYGLQNDFREVVELFLQDLRAVGARPTVTSAKRSSREQESLYREWLAGRRTLPVAKPGTSFHELGLAVDLVFPTVEEWSFAASTAPDYFLAWGGQQDPVHFQPDRTFLNYISQQTPSFFEKRTLLEEAAGFLFWPIGLAQGLIDLMGC